MFVTVFADASYDQKTHAAAWAVWMKGDGMVFRDSGYFKIDIQDSNVAELGAISKGILIAIIQYKPNAIHAVTDSSYAIQRIMKEHRPNCEASRFIVEYLHKQLKRFCVRLTAKHVKGHVSNGERRNFVNNWCDLRAIQLMRMKRAEILEQRDGSGSRDG